MKRTQGGQALIEMFILLAAISLLLFATNLAGISGFLSVQAAHGARLAVFDCDMRPGYCNDSAQVPERQVAARLFSDGKREVLASDNPDLIRFDSAGRNGKIFADRSDIQVRIDLPRVDGSEKNLLSKLADAFRAFASKAGPALFDLSAPDQFTRATATATAWRSGSSGMNTNQRLITMPKVNFQSRVALLSDAWAAIDARDFYDRTRSGENPSQLGNSVTEAFYLPAKDLLLPAFDLIGLETNTRRFRDAFHRVSHEAPYPQTRATFK